MFLCFLFLNLRRVYAFQNFLEQYASRTVEKNEMSCGRRVVDQTPLIVGGEDTKPGDWPWHAAIYQLDRDTLANKYACGGTLVSSYFVLTGKVQESLN